jgi:hypothetical protein
MIESWRREDFDGRVGETFVLHLGADPVPFKLAQVKGGAEPPSRRPQFSLLFRGPRTALRGQGIYRVEHAELGAHDLFLVPVGFAPDEGGAGGTGGDAGGVLFEAVFT